MTKEGKILTVALSLLGLTIWLFLQADVAISQWERCGASSFEAVMGMAVDGRPSDDQCSAMLDRKS